MTKPDETTVLPDGDDTPSIWQPTPQPPRHLPKDWEL